MAVAVWRNIFVATPRVGSGAQGLREGAAIVD
jgi:hypothetical protein